jgi:hypothetical protein
MIALIFSAMINNNLWMCGRKKCFLFYQLNYTHTR